MAEVSVRRATVQVRQVRLTQALLRQVRRMGSVPAKFREPGGNRLRPEYAVGWVHGSLLDDRHTRFVLFEDDGDLFLYNWPGFHQEDVKQIYL